MPKRKDRPSYSNPPATANSESLQGLERQVIEIAEQLGRLAGTAQAKADLWLHEPRFVNQLAKMRDRASSLLGRLGALSGNHNSNNNSSNQARAKSREKVAAPGKKHRPAPMRARGVKHSTQEISTATAARRKRSARPRQG